MSAPEPAALRRHRLRPWWWLLITVAILAIPVVKSVQEIQEDYRHRDEWPKVVGRVPASYDEGRHEVPVEYRHPVTGQLVLTTVVVVRESLLPEPGGSFTIAPNPANPDRVVTPGDGDERRDLILGPGVIIGATLAAGVARWTSVARMKRLVESSRPSFAMLAALHPGGLRGQQVRCSLYALDAKAGSLPVCTFPTLVTAGLPINGPAFPVEVRGRPVPSGLLVARAGERILWPMRRPLTRGNRRRPGRFVEDPARLPTAPAPDQRATKPPSLFVSCGVVAPVLVGAAAVATAIAPFRIVAGLRDSDRVLNGGRPVIAEVIAKDRGKLTVRYGGGGDSGSQQGVASGSRRRVVGRLYPAHVDPADPSRLRLDADPYDAGGPLSFLVVGWGTAILVTWPRVRWWIEARRAARSGPWFSALVSYDDGNLFVHSDDDLSTYVAASRSLPMLATAPFPARVAGTFDPGDGLAIVGPRRAAGPVAKQERLWRRKSGRSSSD